MFHVSPGPDSYNSCHLNIELSVASLHLLLWPLCYLECPHFPPSSAKILPRHFFLQEAFPDYLPTLQAGIHTTSSLGSHGNSEPAVLSYHCQCACLTPPREPWRADSGFVHPQHRLYVHLPSPPEAKSSLGHEAGSENKCWLSHLDLGQSVTLPRAREEKLAFGSKDLDWSHLPTGWSGDITPSL